MRQKFILTTRASGSYKKKNMGNINLNKIHKLLVFRNIYSTPNEYMDEANSLPQIELDTEPLYKIDIPSKMLFTPKLHYYAQVLENEVNRYLNAVNNLLEIEEGGENEELAKYMIKDTRESVVTLIKEANRQLACVDFHGTYWKSQIYGTPDLMTWGGIIESSAYYRYMIAQLVRCWLELQDRYAYIIGKHKYDAFMFYTTFLERTPEKEIEICHTEKYIEETKKFKKSRTDCCFLYDNQEYFATAIQELTNKLKQFKLIPEDIDYKQMESIFRGHPCRRTIPWLGDKHILTSFIKGICNDDDPIVATWPEGTSKWDVVSQRFVDEDGNNMPNLRQETPRKKSQTIVTELIDSLKAYM